MTAELMLDVFKALQVFLKKYENIEKLIYKRIPSIYCSYPADEDLYALYINDGKVVRRDIATTIDIPNHIGFKKRRLRGVKKASKNGVLHRQCNNLSSFMNVLQEMLSERHDTEPVHSLEELEFLVSKFPDNIKLFASYLEEQMVAAILVYETDIVAHAQYIATTSEGRQTGALDGLVNFLITEIYHNKKYFNFGISTEKNGRNLNTGLISQKQEFGGRAMVHDFYVIQL